MSECDGGLPPASPMAVNTRAPNSIPKFTAMPHAPVAALHSAHDHASTLRRLDRSAHAAMGMPRKE